MAPSRCKRGSNAAISTGRSMPAGPMAARSSARWPPPEMGAHRSIGVALLLQACAEQQPDCLTEFSVENGYGFESDDTTAAPPPGDEAASGVDPVKVECESAGASDCEVDVTRAAAECLAE